MIIEEIDYCNPEVICQHFSKDLASLWLDSSMKYSNLGAYSYIAVDPFDIWILKDGILKTFNSSKRCTNPISELKYELEKYSNEHIAELPDFQSGVAGLMSYNFHQYLEPININKIKQDKCIHATYPRKCHMVVSHLWLF